MSNEATAAPTLAASLVIPTHNRRESLRMVLSTLAYQTTPPGEFEVVLICDGCTDGSVEMARSLRVPYCLRVLEQTPNQGPAAARNLGVQEARATLIVFIDDDVVPESTLLAEHLRLHQQDERAVVVGPLLAPPGFALNPWTRWEEAMLVKQYRDMQAGKWQPTPRQFYTGNASVHREHILAAGGFNAQFLRAEDVELAYRLQDLGLRFYFNEEAKGWHHALRSLGAWLNIATAYGKADVAMYRSGRLMTLQSMAREFHWRQPYLQRLARVCIGHPWRVSITANSLLALARVAGWLRQQKLAHAAFSAIYNLRYYQSVSEQLGGAAAFWELVQRYSPRAANAPANLPG
ncbi:MAG TPA: glycosyltransferase family 2 protein [Ktedonobacterales bacterium]